MYLRTIKVRVPRRLVGDFKLVAKEYFPREAFAYLLGRDAGTLVEVEELFVPEDLDKWVTEVSVELSPGWLVAAKRAAKDLGLTVVGDIHSHPFRYCELQGLKPEHTPSEVDIDCGLKQIHGICRVLEASTGKLRATTRFWGPQVPVIEELT